MNEERALKYTYALEMLRNAQELGVCKEQQKQLYKDLLELMDLDPKELDLNI